MSPPTSRLAGAAVCVLACVTVAISALAGCTGGVDVGSVPPSGSPSASTSSTSAGTSPRASDKVSPAHFSDCSDAFNLGSLSFPAGRKAQLSFDCARIDVPVDYAKPDGSTISVALVRVHSNQGGKHKRSLLMNPGGPGASGVELAVSLSAQLDDSVLRSFDLVGFDPRGVGSSSPINCISNKEKDALNAASPDIRTDSGFDQAQRAAKQVATTCSAKYGSKLAQYDTVNTARDMDRVRQAVGDSSMNYLGFSYGTELGAQYAHLFPSKVRTLVLDGAVNPTTDDIASFADQLQGFEDSFDQFAMYCRRTAPCSQLGDARDAVYRLAAKAMRAAIPSAEPGETRKATSSLVYLGVLQALYSKSLWPVLADALRSGLAGDSSGLLSLADQYNQRVDGQYSNITDANTTIGCNDAKAGPTDTTIRKTASSWAQRFPIFGLWSAPSLFSCQQWQPERTPVPLPTAPKTARTVLVVGNVNDPATPYQGAKDLTRTMGNARLFTWVGEGHTSYLQGSSCVDDAVNAYLVKGTVPAKGTTCRN